MKKILSLLMIAVLCFTLVPGTANAAIKLNKKSVTIKLGQTKQLTVSGTSKTVKWSSGNKDIATVSSDGLVKAISIGSTNIIATVSSKKYVCKVTVSDGFNTQESVKGISAEFKDLGKGVIAILTNNNKYPIAVDATMVFYDGAEVALDKSTDFNYYFTPGQKCAMYFSGPYDSSYNNVPYSSFKISYKTQSVGENTISNATEIETKSNIGVDNVMVNVKNNSKKKSTSTRIAIVFYKGGSVVGYDYLYANVETPGSEEVVKFDFPYDLEYNKIQIDNYEIFVNYSYSYTWE